MKTFISQSNYIPWIGFFEAISKVDEYVIFDSVQYSKNDWRNRNQIFDGVKFHWLTIPVSLGNGLQTKIQDVQVSDLSWHCDHLRTIRHMFSRYTYFDETYSFLETCFNQASSLRKLTEINELLLRKFCQELKIDTKIDRCTFFGNEDKNYKLISLLKMRNSSTYLTSTKALNYLDLQLFSQNQVTVEFIDFAESKEFHAEIHGPIGRNVSIINTIMKIGFKELSERFARA